MLDLSFPMPVFVLFSHLGVQLQSEQTEETHVLQPWLKPQSEQWPVLQNIWNDWMHSLSQHAKERDNKTHCHNQTIPGGGGQPPFKKFSSLSLLLLVWETGAKPWSGKGKCSAQMSWSKKSPWTSFQIGSLILWVLLSSLPPLPVSHLQTSRLGRWKQNVSSSNVSQFTVYTNTNSTGFLPSTAVSQCYSGAEKHLDFPSAIKLIAF